MKMDGNASNGDSCGDTQQMANDNCAEHSTSTSTLFETCLTSRKRLGLFATEGSSKEHASLQRMRCSLWRQTAETNLSMCQSNLRSCRRHNTMCSPAFPRRGPRDEMRRSSGARFGEGICTASLHPCADLSSRAKLIRNKQYKDKTRLDDTFLELAVQDELAMLKILMSNVIEFGAEKSVDAERSVDAGVFAATKRISHSCTPNVHISYNPTLNKMTVHAVRDIQIGEELARACVDVCKPRCARAWELEQRDIDCDCGACEVCLSFLVSVVVFAYIWQPSPSECMPTLTPGLTIRRALSQPKATSSASVSAKSKIQSRTRLLSNHSPSPKSG